MALIAFFTDLESGHTLASFGLARALQLHGNHVVFLGLPDAKAQIVEQGFAFEEIMADLFPLGSRHRLNDSAASAQQLYFGPVVRGEVLHDVMNRVRPDSVLINSLLALEALTIRYLYEVPVMLLTTSFLRGSRRERSRSIIDQAFELKAGVTELLTILKNGGIRMAGLHDVADVILDFPEFILCPREFNLFNRSNEPNVFYIGAALDCERNEPEFAWDSFDSRKPLIFCSLGTQWHRRSAAVLRFFDRVIRVFQGHPEWELLISLGGVGDPTVISAGSPNVHVHKWAPQFHVLKRAAAMITHAGIGSVRECIHCGVPLIAFPIMRDQFDAAQVLVKSGLGVTGNINIATTGDIERLVAGVINESGWRSRVKEIQASFNRPEDIDHAVRMIETRTLTACA